MNRIIVSSKWLHETLKLYLDNLNKASRDYPVKVRCENELLYFGESALKNESEPVKVMSKFEWSTDIEIQNLRRLLKILLIVGDQPIVINFDSSHRIIIDNLFI